MISVNINEEMDYCYDIPFFPPDRFIELEKWQTECVDDTNKVYEFIRKTLHNMRLDRDNIGTKNWSPFKDFIKEGDFVFVKPNLVIHNNGGESDIRAVVTHASVIRPIIDYCLLALNGTGKIVVGDAPQANADFEKIVERNGLKDLVKWYKSKGVNIDLVDLRKNYYPDGFVSGIRKDLPGDANGYVCTDLKDNSFFDDFPHIKKMYGADFDRNFIVEQHTGGHKYLVSASILNADVVISVPKLKTHRKAGVTANAKNMVGANGDKNYLAHYCVGNENGGDEFPPDVSIWSKIYYRYNRFASDYILIRNTYISRLIYKVLKIPFWCMGHIYEMITKKPIFFGLGDWYGNDTVWRMILDLNQIIIYADKLGNICKYPQRKYISIVDGVIAGEGDGPLEPSAKRAGLIVIGIGNPFEVDNVCIHLMGFDYRKIKSNYKASTSKKFAFCPENIDVICEYGNRMSDYRNVNLQFIPQSNWIGHIER